MDVQALACGRLDSALREGASCELGGDLRELLFLDDAMWAEDDVDTPPGEPRRSGGGVGAQGGAFAPAGVRESALPAAGTEQQSAAAAADGGHARVCAHPLWPVLVDYYFSCRKVRAPRRRARAVAAAAPAARATATSAVALIAADSRALPPQVGANDSATIRSINSERAELAQRVQEVRQRQTTAVSRRQIPSVTSEATRATPRRRARSSTPARAARPTSWAPTPSSMPSWRVSLALARQQLRIAAPQPRPAGARIRLAAAARCMQMSLHPR